MEINPFKALDRLDPIVLLIIGLFAIGAIICQIFYLITLMRTMEQVHPTLRKMPPGQVWLVLIPIFGIIWNFIMIGHIADSLQNEFKARNIQVDEARPGYNVGLIMCIAPLIGFLPMIGILGSVAGLVCWIIYWSKMAGYKRTLEQTRPNVMNPFMQQPTF